jgi:hypothetical protein
MAPIASGIHSEKTLKHNRCVRHCTATGVSASNVSQSFCLGEKLRHVPGNGGQCDRVRGTGGGQVIGAGLVHLWQRAHEGDGGSVCPGALCQRIKKHWCASALGKSDLNEGNLSNDRSCLTTNPRSDRNFWRGLGWSDRTFFRTPGRTATLVVVRQGGG